MDTVVVNLKGEGMFIIGSLESKQYSKENVAGHM